MEQVATLESITPQAYNETLEHVDHIGNKTWRANIATRLHNDALVYAQSTATTIDADPEALIDWLCKQVDTIYAKHLQTLNQWEEATLADTIAQDLALSTNSQRETHVAWLAAFLETVQANSSMTKKHMNALIDAASDAVAALPIIQTAPSQTPTPAAPKQTLVGRRIAGKRARKLLANFKH
ncbi:hypothetical protein [Lacticaseibacillus jixiensis]|uniref:hypothetical protein n=1 Tax=Lacticaseibacillus jixiensis TaxID=3231926 RepID=UPI0036F30A2D